MANYTTTTAPLPWMEPYLQDLAARGNQVANQAYQQSPGTYVGPNNLLTQGWQAIANRAMQGSPVMGTANQTLQNTLSGQYVNSNPYLSQMVGNINADVTKSYNDVAVPKWAQMNQGSGSYGNTGVAQAFSGDRENLMKTLANNATSVYGNAYNQERQMQNAAM